MSKVATLALKCSRGSAAFPWVAKIEGVDPDYQWVRVFQKGYSEYTHNFKTKTKKLKQRSLRYFHIRAGVYEVFAYHNYNTSYRYFIQVFEDGTFAEIGKEHVLVYLEKENENARIAPNTPQNQ